MKVLIPYDGTELSEQAAAMTIEILAQHRLELLLLRVASGPGQATEEQASLAALVERFVTAPAAVRPILAFGHPAEEIVRVADQRGADVIAMATRARSDLGRMLLGSVTDRVIQTSPVPVLAVHLPTTWLDGLSSTVGRRLRLLAPLDGSAFAEEAVEMAVSLLRPELVEVGLVSIVATPRTETPTAREALDAAAARLGARGVPVTETILEGEPARQIAGLAFEERYDLIVMSTHGLSALLRTLVGSITDRVLRISEMPVLVIQPRSMDTPRDPVTGEEVDPNRAASSTEYHGRVFSFTSFEHKQQFDSAPEAYVGRRLAAPTGPEMYEGLAQTPAAIYAALADRSRAIPSPTREA